MVLKREKRNKEMTDGSTEVEYRMSYVESASFANYFSMPLCLSTLLSAGMRSDVNPVSSWVRCHWMVSKKCGFPRSTFAIEWEQSIDWCASWLWAISAFRFAESVGSKGCSHWGTTENGSSRTPTNFSQSKHRLVVFHLYCIICNCLLPGGLG